MKKLRYLLILLLFACHPTSENGEENVLARVYDEYLFESDVDGLLPPGTSTRDSLILVKNYISNWVKNKVLVYKAEENLSYEQQDFSNQLEEYKNSLLVFEYEKILLDKELDTSISNDEIITYYNEFQNNFPLREDLYQIRYIFINESDFNLEIKEYFLDTLKASNDTIYKLLAGISDNFEIESGVWLSSMEFKRRFPVIRTYDIEDLVAGAYFEMDKNPELIMINIASIRETGELSPFIKIKPQIREIILNKRKSTFLKNLKQEILEQAISKNEIEIY